MKKYKVEFVDNAYYSYNLILEAENVVDAENKALKILNGCRIEKIEETKK